MVLWLSHDSIWTSNLFQEYYVAFLSNSYSNESITMSNKMGHAEAAIFCNGQGCIWFSLLTLSWTGSFFMDVVVQKHPFQFKLYAELVKLSGLNTIYHCRKLLLFFNLFNNMKRQLVCRVIFLNVWVQVSKLTGFLFIYIYIHKHTHFKI